MSSDWAASTLRWWSDAGVDVIVGEEPRDWLNPVPKAPATVIAQPAAASPLPDTLAEFEAWLMTSADVPEASPSAPRIGPAGDATTSGLMVVTDVPALADFADGHLVSSDGLFDKMLGAIQLSRESIYLTSLSPLRPPSGTLSAQAMRRCAEITKHHISLVAPRTILLLGDICSRALVGAGLSQSRSKWHEIETSSGHFRALVTLKPEQLNLQPNLKTLAWADLQMLKEGMIE